MKVTIKEIRAMSDIEREKKLTSLRDDLLKIRSSKSMGSTMQDPSKIGQIRRAIARILTVMKQNAEI
jgi:large subunit ribosomal protein L29